MSLVVYDQLGRKYRVVDGFAKTKFGRIPVSGEGAFKHEGKRFFSVKANLLEEVESFKMGGRPVYPYDSGIMLSLLGVCRGSRVLDAGTGSGAVAFHAWNMGADVTTYERVPEFHEKAKENLKEMDVKLVQGEVTECDATGFDAVFLDLPDPETVIPKVAKCLKDGGMLGYYSPVINESVKRLLEDSGFIDVKGIILDHRVLRMKKYTGIASESLGFPGFFVWGRKADDFKVVDKERIKRS